MDISSFIANRKPVRLEPWPLRFSRYSFGADCYNTLRCDVLFANHRHTIGRFLSEPSGVPHRADWKDHWTADFSSDGAGFPTPVEVSWTALDGVAREVEIDLDSILPDRRIVHSVPREDVEEEWASRGYSGTGHRVELLLEVNDRRLALYMKSRIQTRHMQRTHDGFDVKTSVFEKAEVWSKVY